MKNNYSTWISYVRETATALRVSISTIIEPATLTNAAAAASDVIQLTGRTHVASGRLVLEPVGNIYQICSKMVKK